MSENRHREVKKREATFAKRLTTRIWEETPSPDNPYLAAGARCHGYDLLELAGGRRFSDVVFLLMQGELPNQRQSRLFEAALVCLVNPGPRHPAARAAMNAGVGRTKPEHVLPIALSVAGGEHLGGAQVEAALRFLRSHRDRDPEETATMLVAEIDSGKPGDRLAAPGFGSHFGSADPFAASMAGFLSTKEGGGPCLAWGNRFAKALAPHSMGWLTTGVAGAVFADLGFHPRAASGLFQLAAAPGLLAHGLEYSNRPVTDMPFPDGEDYVIDKSGK